MNSYVCNRDGNALEWETHPTRPGGRLVCWQCEQRLRNGLPLLPEKVEIPLDALRKMSDDVHSPRQVYPDSARYQQITTGIREAKAINHAFNRARAQRERNERLKAERRARGLRVGGWTDKESQSQHLRWTAAERERKRRLAAESPQYACA